MKIALIGKRNHLYWDYHTKIALEELGHKVFHFQINKRPLSLNIMRNIVKPFGKKELSDKIYALLLQKRLKEFKPDFIFLTHAFFIPVVYYKTLKELNIPIFAWDGDGGANCDAMKQYRDYIDILFESELNYVRENRVGFKQIEYLPFCANPKIFKPMDLRRENYIFFAGAATPKRVETIKKIKHSMKIRGWGWSNMQNPLFDVKNNKLDMHVLVSEYNKSLIALNIHQEVNHIEALNMRTFEVPACETLLICDYRKELELHFDLEKELLVYTDENIGNIIEKLQNRDLIKKITKNGYKKVLASHTYTHRMQEVLKYIN